MILRLFSLFIPLLFFASISCGVSIMIKRTFGRVIPLVFIIETK